MAEEKTSRNELHDEAVRTVLQAIVTSKGHAASTLPLAEAYAWLQAPSNSHGG